MSLGLDVGTKLIKIVELEKDGEAFSLKSSGIVPNSGKPLENIEDEKEMAVIAESIIRLKKDAGIDEKNVNISLPERSVFSRVISFPPLTEQEVASAVKWEAEQYIPIPIEDAIVQHQIIGSGISPKDKSGKERIAVLLVAAPKKLVEKYLKVAQLARLEVQSVETEMIALSRSVSIPNQLVLAVDMGASSTNMAVSKGSQLLFSRSVPTGGDVLTRSITQSLGINVQQAEQYKKAYGLDKNQLEGKIYGSLSPIMGTIFDEIKKTIQFYQNEYSGGVPGSVMLSGGGAGIQEIISFASEKLGVEVGIINPFSKMKIEEATLKKLAPYLPFYSIAVGCAMRT